MSKATAEQTFTLIAACQGLQSLDLKLEVSYWWNGQAAQLPGLKECLVALQGLKNLTVGVEELPDNHHMKHWMEQAKGMCKQLEPLFKERMTMSRSKT
jgi:predicted RNA-binding protein with EMAP domain